jgi:hypothetical protein
MAFHKAKAYSLVEVCRSFVLRMIIPSPCDRPLRRGRLDCARLPKTCGVVVGNPGPLRDRDQKAAAYANRLLMSAPEIVIIGPVRGTSRTYAFQWART